jgi:hypothetical protein
MPSQVSDADELLNLFRQLYLQKYGRRAAGNRVRDYWTARSVFDDIGAEASEASLRFFFDTVRDDHTWKDYVYNYDLILEEMRRHNKDKQEIRRKMQRAKARAEGK